jgi:hypothetical protein
VRFVRRETHKQTVPRLVGAECVEIDGVGEEVGGDHTVGARGEQIDDRFGPRARAARER